MKELLLLEKFGCIPQSWISADGNEDDNEVCNETNLRKIEPVYQFFNNETKTLADQISTRGSCDRMSVIALSDEVTGNTEGQNFTIEVRYVSQDYQEVQ